MDAHNVGPPVAAPSPFSQRALIAVGIGLAVFGLAFLLWYVVQVLLLVFAGVLLAIVLRTLADWVGGATGLASGPSLALVLLLLVVGVGGLGWHTAPRVAEQLDLLVERVPQYVDHLESHLEEYGWGAWLLEQRPRDIEIIWRATGVLSTGLGMLFGLGIVLLIGIYLAVDPWLYTSGLLLLVPPAHRQRAREVLAAVGYTLRWWLIGQLVAMTAVGIMTAFGLWLLGVRLWLTLGLLAFLLDFVPYFGPIAAAVPGILLALADSPTKGLYVTIMYVVVQQIESVLLVPLIQKRAVLLPPVLTIVAQVLMGILAGIMGILFATPLMATLMVLVKMVYVESVLGEEIPTPDDDLSEEDLPPLPTPPPVKNHGGSNRNRPPPAEEPPSED